MQRSASGRLWKPANVCGKWNRFLHLHASRFIRVTQNHNGAAQTLDMLFAVGRTAVRRSLVLRCRSPQFRPTGKLTNCVRFGEGCEQDMLIFCNICCKKVPFQTSVTSIFTVPATLDEKRTPKKVKGALPRPKDTKPHFQHNALCLRQSVISQAQRKETLVETGPQLLHQREEKLVNQEPSVTPTCVQKFIRSLIVCWLQEVFQVSNTLQIPIHVFIVITMSITFHLTVTQVPVFIHISAVFLTHCSPRRGSYWFWRARPVHPGSTLTIPNHRNAEKQQVPVFLDAYKLLPSCFIIIRPFCFACLWSTSESY